MRRFIIALSAFIFVSIQMSPATVEEPSVEVRPIVKWDMKQLFDRGGHVGASSFLDVNDDGQKEFICNIGSSADFAAIETDAESFTLHGSGHPARMDTRLFTSWKREPRELRSPAGLPITIKR